MSELAIEMRGVSRRFGKNVANDKVDLEVRQGTVHAVVGENGAGKSTLMKIAYGQIRADEGEIRIKGEAVKLAKHSPMQAIDRGVGMVHQHFMLVPPLTVVENVVLGREPIRGGFLDLEKAETELRALSKKYGLEVHPEKRVEDLSVGEQQRVEIIKVLWQGCDILILDEPTAVLTPLEVEQLFEVLRGLVAEGVSVVMITHKLDEVVAIADDITVMRRAKVVDKLEGKGASVESIAQAMVGRSVLLEVDKSPAKPGETVLAVRRLKALSDAGLPALEGVSLEVRAGEILGVAGVEGNGQTELQECIVGLRKPTAGRILLEDEPLHSLSVAQRYERGLAHIPEDRHHRAIILDFSTEENLVLGRQQEFSGRVAIDQQACDTEAQKRIAEVDIRPTDPGARAGAMSGGNQQKIVVARELNRPNNKLLICAQPTRGVDIGAIELIHKLVIKARDAGLAVLLFSAELSELQSLSDRLVVLYGGEVALEMDADALAQEDARATIGAAMTGAGAHAQEAAGD
jgi:simple sugar transport system ATP-binding protein